MKYKVIKEFGSARKGDVLENSDEDPYMFTLEVEDTTDNGTYYRNMSISYDLIETYKEDGYLTSVPDISNTEQVVDYIDYLISDYSNKLKKADEYFNEGTIQPCVKLESDTVHTNLIKVLLEIKKRLINE